MAGELLYKVTTPSSLEARVQTLEETVKKIRRFQGTGMGVGSNGTFPDGTGGTWGGMPIPQPEIASVSQTDGFTPEGQYQPSLLVQIEVHGTLPDGANGYEVLVQPQSGASYPIRGPVVDNIAGVGWVEASKVVVPRSQVTSTLLSARVVGPNGLAGEYGPEVLFAVAQDTTAPPVPTGVTTDGSRLGAVHVNFNLPLINDYAYTEIYKGVGDFALGAGVKVATSRIGHAEFAWDNILDTQAGYNRVKARHIDWSGNASLLSAAVVINTRLVGSGDLGSGSVTPTKTALGVNLLWNGGLEVPNDAGTFPDGFVNGGGTVTWDSTLKASGSKGIKMGGVAGTHQLYSPEVMWPWGATPGVGNEALYLGVWLYTAQGVGATYSIKAAGYDASHNFVSAITFTPAAGSGTFFGAGSSTWQHVHCFIPAQAVFSSAVVYIRIWLSLTIPAGGNGYWGVDCFEVAPATQTLVANSIEFYLPDGTYAGKVRADLNTTMLIDSTMDTGISVSASNTALFATGGTYGIYGISTTGTGVIGNSSSGLGLWAVSNSGTALKAGSQSGVTAWFEHVSSSGQPTVLAKAATGQTSNIFEARNASNTAVSGFASNGQGFIMSGSSRADISFSPIQWSATAIMPLTANAQMDGCLPGNGVTNLITGWSSALYIAGTSNTTNYWTISLLYTNASGGIVLKTWDTKAILPNSWQPHYEAMSNITTGYTLLEITFTKTGAPGNLYYTPQIEVRKLF